MNMETWKVPIAQPIHHGLCCLSIRITPIVLKQNSQPDCILETDIIKTCTECTNRKFSDLWIECTGLKQTLVNGILEQLFIMTGWGVMTCAGVAVAPSVVIVRRRHEHRWTHLEWSRSCRSRKWNTAFNIHVRAFPCWINTPITHFHYEVRSEFVTVNGSSVCLLPWMRNRFISKPEAWLSHFSSVGVGVEADWLESKGSSVLHLLTFPNVMRAFNTWNRGISEETEPNRDRVIKAIHKISCLFLLPCQHLNLSSWSWNKQNTKPNQHKIQHFKFYKIFLN